MTGLTKKRFLVIDDEPAIRNLLSEILSGTDCIVDIAENGKHALQMLKKNSYDLILSDITMPEMDGISFYRVVAENSPETKGKILFMTGNLNENVIAFFEKHGCNYIAKPNLFDESGLLYQINNILSR